MTMPSFRVAGLLAAAAIAVAACGNATISPSPTPVPTPTPVVTPVPTPTPTPVPTYLRVASLQPTQLVVPGTLTVCSDTQSAPQEFLDAQGAPTGSDVELAREMAKRMGLQLAVLSTPVATIVATMAANKCDITVSGQTITSATLGKVDMIPYFQTGQAFVVARGNPSGIKTTYDLCGKSDGVRKGSSEADHLNGQGAYSRAAGLIARCLASRAAAVSAKTYAKDADGLLAIGANKIVAYFMDSPAAGYAVFSQPDLYQAVQGLVLNTVTEGISINKGRNEMYAAVKIALQSMIDDHTYLQILQKYGVESGAVASTNP
jgi:polar amino acid transport system substrate-binding protein